MLLIIVIVLILVVIFMFILFLLFPLPIVSVPFLFSVQLNNSPQLHKEYYQKEGFEGNFSPISNSHQQSIWSLYFAYLSFSVGKVFSKGCLCLKDFKPSFSYLKLPYRENTVFINDTRPFFYSNSMKTVGQGIREVWIGFYHLCQKLLLHFKGYLLSLSLCHTHNSFLIQTLSDSLPVSNNFSRYTFLLRFCPFVSLSLYSIFLSHSALGLFIEFVSILSVHIHRHKLTNTIIHLPHNTFYTHMDCWHYDLRPVTCDLWSVICDLCISMSNI